MSGRHGQRFWISRGLGALSALALLATPLRVAAAPLAQAATFCTGNAAPSFTTGFADLKNLVGDPMGVPLTCAFADPSGTSDVYQRTSTGVAFWRSSTNLYTFTNGLDHWASTPIGGLYWSGASVDPPPTARPFSGPGDALPAQTPPASPAAEASDGPSTSETPSTSAESGPLPDDAATPSETAVADDSAAAPDASTVDAAESAIAPDAQPDSALAEEPSAALDAGVPVPAAGGLTTARQTFVPVSITIPRLDLVDTPIAPTGLEEDGAMSAPSDPDTVGWYEYGPGVGGPGNAILAAHVDWGGRLRVFGFLRYLAPGDTVTVTAEDGAQRVYVVQWRESYDAADAPLDVIFGQGDDQELTLITCDGYFDPVAHVYVNRLVVRATLAGDAGQVDAGTLAAESHTPGGN